MKFSPDALLAAAATIVGARIQAMGGVDADASQMLLRAMTEVLDGVDLMDDEAMTENADRWARMSS